MLNKMMAFFMAVYLFFAGIPYGSEPVKVEFEYEIPSQVKVCEPGDLVSMGKITVTNVGRPFKGTDPFEDCVNEFMYQVIDGKTVILKSWQYITAEEPRTAIIKHGYTHEVYYSFHIEDDAVPGIYSLQVSCGGSTQVFENVLEVRAKNM